MLMIAHEKIEELIEAFTDAPRLAEMEVRAGDGSILRLRRSLTSAEQQRTTAPSLTTAKSARTTIETKTPPLVSGNEVTVATPETGTLVTSTLVGIFRQSTGRDSIQVGSTVPKGRVLGSIDVMHLMNDVVAPTGGTILTIFVQNGQPVEYGQPLFEIGSSIPTQQSTQE